jgi:hypothetical protein
MKISQAFPSKYLTAADCPDGVELKCIIQGVTEEKLRDGIKPVLHLDQGQLVLNATNARSIASKLGDESDDWAGQQLIIYRSLIDYPEPDTPCLRVRVPQESVKHEVVRPVPSKRGDGGDDMADEIPF